MLQSWKIVKTLRSSWRKSLMRHWNDAMISKRSLRLLNKLSRKKVLLRMKVQQKKSFKLRQLEMTNKRRRKMKKTKRKSCHHFQILFHLRLRLQQMQQKKPQGRMKSRRPSKKKMQNRVKSQKRAKLRKYQLSRKHK